MTQRVGADGHQTVHVLMPGGEPEVASSLFSTSSGTLPLDRDLKNVQEDLRILEEYGLVRMTRNRGVGRRKVKVPEALFDEIALKVAI